MLCASGPRSGRENFTRYLAFPPLAPTSLALPSCTIPCNQERNQYHDYDNNRDHYSLHTTMTKTTPGPDDLDNQGNLQCKSQRTSATRANNNVTAKPAQARRSLEQLVCPAWRGLGGRPHQEPRTTLRTSVWVNRTQPATNTTTPMQQIERPQQRSQRGNTKDRPATATRSQRRP